MPHPIQRDLRIGPRGKQRRLAEFDVGPAGLDKLIDSVVEVSWEALGLKPDVADQLVGLRPQDFDEANPPHTLLSIKRRRCETPESLGRGSAGVNICDPAELAR